MEDAVKGPVVGVSREEVLQALNEMKTRKAPGPSEVSQELIAASRGVGIQVMAEMRQSPRWIWNASGMGAKLFQSSNRRVTSGTAAATEL